MNCYGTLTRLLNQMEDMLTGLLADDDPQQPTEQPNVIVERGILRGVDRIKRRFGLGNKDRRVQRGRGVRRFHRSILIGEKPGEVSV